MDPGTPLDMKTKLVAANVTNGLSYEIHIIWREPQKRIDLQLASGGLADAGDEPKRG